MGIESDAKRESVGFIEPVERNAAWCSRCSRKGGEHQCGHARGGDGGAVAFAPSPSPPEPRGDGAFGEGHDGPGDEGRRDACPFPAQRPVRRSRGVCFHPSRRVARPRGRVALRGRRGRRETCVGLIPPEPSDATEAAASLKRLARACLRRVAANAGDAGDEGACIEPAPARTEACSSSFCVPRETRRGVTKKTRST